MSLAGAKAALHAWHTGTEVGFGEATQGLKAAIASGVPTSVSSVVTRSSYRHLSALVEAASRLGAGAVHLALARPYGRARAAVQRIVPPASLVQESVQAALLHARRRRLPTFVSGMPLCLLRGFEESALELHYPAAEPGREHLPPCEACTLRAHCPGLPAGLPGALDLPSLSPEHRDLGDALARARQRWAEAARLFAGLGAVPAHPAPGAGPAAGSC